MKKYKQRHKMPEKKEGVRTTCTKCRSDIICRMSDYTDHENKLQWQNEDGTAHYQCIDKKFTCRLPITGDETMIQGEPAKVIRPGNLSEEWD